MSQIQKKKNMKRSSKSQNDGSYEMKDEYDSNGKSSKSTGVIKLEKKLKQKKSSSYENDNQNVS